LKNKLQIGNTITIVLTFIFFSIALFTTGFTKELLLEAGVLLVSIKIIFMGASSRKSISEILAKLDEINKKIFNCKSNESV